MSNHRNTSEQLRELLIFSGSDHFMTNGHQIINSNRSHAGPARKDATWALDDAVVQKILRTTFPKVEIDVAQRERAGKWVRIIHLYFRSAMSFGDVAAEMGVKPKFVRNVLQKINYVRKGLSTQGKPRLGKATGTDLGDQ
jgi:hypothetical protein